MIPYVSPAYTVPRQSFRERKRESLVSPVPAVFELRDSSYRQYQGQQSFEQAPDIGQMQAQAYVSRLQFDMAFNKALQDLETDGSGGELFHDFA